ncbi:GAF domain-containing protein [Streptomyces sp. NPDC010273]|uniref:GAF and ANTAR domain-containing protein n=1 Tax=Streptomyces sp. NPDC010273 TaxID=3364829 RepID=UPI0036E8C0E5
MAGDDLVGGGDAEQNADVERARIAHELIAGVRGLSPPDVPGALCRRCVTLLPAASGLSASVLADGPDTGVMLFASDDVAARLAEIQYTLGEGPCREAVRLRAPAFGTNLTRATEQRRWPLFSLQAAEAGVEAVFSLPLMGAGSALGTLDLYRETPGALGPDGIRTASLVADAVTLAVIALDHASPDPHGVATWLAGVVSDREEVHQATGMAMVLLGVGASEALLRLRARAFAEGRTSTEVARDVIDRNLDLGVD